MDRKVLAICDEERRYAVRLMEAFCEKRNSRFQTHVFSDVAELEQFASHNQIEILLITGRLMSEDIQCFNIGKIILLSDGEVYEKFSDYESIYKYQSADHILKEILCCYAEYAKPVTGMHYGKKEFEIHGVYSPIGRCGKSVLAQELASAFGKHKKTLLLDFQSFSASLEQLGEEELWDLADMIYFLRQGKKTFLYKLGSIVRSKESYDYILPMKTPADIRSVTLGEWTELLEKLAADSEYQIVVIDFGSEICDIFQLLGQCKKIYTPMISDADSQKKMSNFEKILTYQNFERILDNMYKITIPLGCEKNMHAFMKECAERFVMS